MQTGSCARGPLDPILIFRSFPGDVFATFIIINKMILEVRLFIQEEGKLRETEKRAFVPMVTVPMYRDFQQGDLPLTAILVAFTKATLPSSSSTAQNLRSPLALSVFPASHCFGSSAVYQKKLSSKFYGYIPLSLLLSPISPEECVWIKWNKEKTDIFFTCPWVCR